MGISNIFALVIGFCALFLGIFTLRAGLLALAGSKLEAALATFTKTTLRAFLFGIGVTALVQSSGAVTVALVGLVGAGLMPLRRAITVVLGANVGTTFTTQLLAGGGGANLSLFGPFGAAVFIALTGAGFIIFKPLQKHNKLVGRLFLGCGLLFCGMALMKWGAAPLQNAPFFTGLFSRLESPLLGFIGGTFATAAMQSSTASVALLQALAATGSITRMAAYPIILGQNLGTCFTTVAAAVPAGKAAGQVALAHLYINLFGGLFAVAGLYIISGVIAGFLAVPITAAGIANFHTFYNIACAVLFLPFTRQLALLTGGE